MLTKRIAVAATISVATALALPPGTALAQAYPQKAIRMLTAGAPGGGNDIVSRMISQNISVSLGQPVIVDNRASATVAEAINKAAPDGYTYLIAHGFLIITPLLGEATYDPAKDFSSVALVCAEPSILVVHPSIPARSVQELVALAKAKPGTLNYSSSIVGSSGQLAAELFKSLAGVNITAITYKNTTQALTDLIAGRVQLSFITTSSMDQIKSAKMIPLAVTAGKPSALVPDLPTIAASGVPGYEMVDSTDVWAPPKTPRAFINRFNQDIVRAVKGDLRKKLQDLGQDIVASSPDELEDFRTAEIAKWRKLIKETGLKAPD